MALLSQNSLQVQVSTTHLYLLHYKPRKKQTSLSSGITRNSVIAKKLILCRPSTKSAVDTFQEWTIFYTTKVELILDFRRAWSNLSSWESSRFWGLERAAGIRVSGFMIFFMVDGIDFVLNDFESKLKCENTHANLLRCNISGTVF